MIRPKSLKNKKILKKLKTLKKVLAKVRAAIIIKNV